jgi:hypothetical protein
MTLTAVNAISAMVAPVVLLTTGGMLSNGLLSVFGSINDRMREMPRERVEILTGPEGEIRKSDRVGASGRERLAEIDAQLPLMLRRHRLTKTSVLTIYSAIAVLGLSIIAIAVGVDSEVIARVALGLVLAGTVVVILGLAIAAMSLAKSADAITYAVERTKTLGGLVTFLANPLTDGAGPVRLRRPVPDRCSWLAGPSRR